MKSQPHQIMSIRLQSETDEQKTKYYNKESAHKRQKELSTHVDKFLANGGEITKLPHYDEVIR